MHFRSDVLNGFRPDERFRGTIMVAEVLRHRLNEPSDATKDSTANTPLRQVAEPAFDRGEPRTRRRDEVQVEAGMPSHPPAHGGVRVRGVIVQDQMQLERGRRLRIDLLEKLATLVVPMARQAVTDHVPIKQAQRRKQGGRAVALIIVRHGAAPTVLHREARLGAIQGLDLAFLIHAEDEGMLGRVQLQAYDILHFLLEVRIPAERERADPLRLEAVCLPHVLGAFDNEG